MFTPSNLKNSKVRHISALKMRTILQQGDTHNSKGWSDHILKEELDTDTQNSSLCVENICFQSGGVFRAGTILPPLRGIKNKKIKQVRIEVPVLRMLMKITY